MSKTHRSRKNSPPFVRMPSGRGGGQAGAIRGDISEGLVNIALELLKDQNKIIGFYKDDGGGKDFVVWVWTGHGKKKKRCPMTIEVKSSLRGVRKYQAKGKQDGKTPADAIVIANKDRDFFIIAHNIEAQLGLSSHPARV